MKHGNVSSNTSTSIDGKRASFLRPLFIVFATTTQPERDEGPE